MLAYRKLSLLLCGALSLLTSFNTLAGEYHKVKAPPAVDLKKYMAGFGTMLASLEILRSKEKEIDWAAIDVALQEMSKNLAALQKTDRGAAYKEFTDVLAAGFVELNEKSRKRDKTFFNSLDQLSEACFKCHAAHRPGDYRVPRNGKRLSSQD